MDSKKNEIMSSKDKTGIDIVFLGLAFLASIVFEFYWIILNPEDYIIIFGTLIIVLIIGYLLGDAVRVLAIESSKKRMEQMENLLKAQKALYLITKMNQSKDNNKLSEQSELLEAAKTVNMEEASEDKQVIKEAKKVQEVQEAKEVKEVEEVQEAKEIEEIKEEPEQQANTIEEIEVTKEVEVAVTDDYPTEEPINSEIINKAYEEQEESQEQEDLGEQEELGEQEDLEVQKEQEEQEELQRAIRELNLNQVDATTVEEEKE